MIADVQHSIFDVMLYFTIYRIFHYLSSTKVHIEFNMKTDTLYFSQCKAREELYQAIQNTYGSTTMNDFQKSF